MKKLLLSITCLWMLLSCGSDSLFHPDANQKMTLSIHLVPSSLLGTNGASISAKKVAMVSLDEEVELWGIVHIGDSVLSLSEADSFAIRNSYWIVEGDTLSGSKLSGSFDKAAIDTIQFHAIDLLGDTLRDTLILYVNTPLKITAVSPLDNQLDLPLSTTNALDFHWTLSGVDSWETPVVSLHLVNNVTQIDKADAVASSIGTSLHLPVSPSACPADSQCRYWWRLTVSVQSPMALRNEDFDSSDIRMFQSRRTDVDSARISLSVTEENGNNATGIIVNAHRVNQSESQRWTFNPTTGFVTSPNLTPGNWIITAWDSLFTEYASESLRVDLGAGVLHNLGEILVLRDRIAPQVEPWRDSRMPYDIVDVDSLVFLLEDNGTGLDTATIQASWGTYPATSIIGNRVVFQWTTGISNSQLATPLKIWAKDRAGNSNSNCTWSIKKMTNSPLEGLVYGPYCSSIDTTIQVVP